MSAGLRKLALRILVAAYLLALWVDQVFYAPLDKGAIRLSDIIASIAAVTILTLHRDLILRILCSPAVLWCLALFASLLISTLIAEGTLVPRPTMRLGIQLALVFLFAIVAAVDAQWFARAVYRGAAAIVLVAAVGFLAALLFNLDSLEWANHRPAFLVRDGHPLLGDWPRPVGGLSRAAEKFGTWAMVASAVLFAGASFRGTVGIALLAVSALVAAATLTISASGGLLFVAVWLHFRGFKKIAYGTAASTILVLAIAQIPVHVSSIPDQVDATTLEVDCMEAHPDHIARSSLSSDLPCSLLPAWSGTVLTRYGLAKRHAYEVWSASPVLGAGQAEFSRHAKRAQDRRGIPVLWAYASTHSAVAGTAAEHGILGLLLFVAFAVALVRSVASAPQCRTQRLALSLILAGFAAACLSQDSHKERLFWAVAGYAIGLSLTRNPKPEEATP